MKNTLTDLNNYLFEAIERVMDDSLTPEQLETELKRADMLTKIADKQLDVGELAFKTMVHMDEFGFDRKSHVPSMLELKE